MKQNCIALALTILFTSLSVLVFSQTPQITQHPLSGEKCVGNSVIFSVEATGGAPLHYQWYFEDNPVGSDSPEFSIPSLTPANDGVYHCVVWNVTGSATSNDAILLVAGGIPVINSNSADVEICAGADLALSVNATADYESYTWYMQNNGLIEYGQTMNINNVTGENSGTYYCEVYNVCGSVNSALIVVQVNEPPQFVSLPVSVEICEGNDASFTVTATGTDISYKWLADDVEIPGEIDNTLTIENIEYPHYVFYKPVVYNTCSTIVGEAVSASVFSNPQITGNPVSEGLCGGEEFHLIATATSNIPLSYQWYYNETLLEGETNNYYDGVTEEGFVDSYYCIISNSCSEISTDIAEITGYESAVITQQPDDATVCSGTNVSLHIKASGTEVLYYQWLFNEANVAGDNIVGENTETLQINDITVGQAGSYTCFVYNECGSALSEVAEIIVNTAPEILIQPEDIVLCEGQDAEADILISGTLPVEYDWTNEGSGLSVGNSEELLFSNITADLAGIYMCTLSNVCGDVTSDSFEIVVNTYPEVMQLSEDIAACAGDSVALFVMAEGTEPIEYLWFRNSSAESWATNDTIIFDPAEFGNTGIYFCRMYNLCGIIDSDPVEFYIGTPPTIQWHSGTQYLCEWDTLNLVVDPAGEFINFQWYFNDEIMLGETDSVLNIPQIDESMAGVYVCRVYNSCDEVLTADIEVNINPAPDVDLGDDIETCENIQVILHPEGDFQSYSWNDGLSSGPQLEVELSGTYWVQVVGQNACSNYDTIHVEIHPVAEVNFGNDISSCGEYLLVVPEGAYSYNWSTGASGVNQITVTESGTYSLTTTGDSFGCQSNDEVDIEILEIPYIDLGPDHIIANDSIITIGVDAIYSDYIWYNGFNGPILTVNGDELGVGEHDIWLRVIAENQCTFTDSVMVTVYDASGYNGLQNTNYLLVHPNPSSGLVHFSGNVSFSGLAIIEIYDLSSDKVFSGKYSFNNIFEESFDFTFLAPGVYFISLITENGERHTSKISIQ